MTILIENARLLTLDGPPGMRRGAAMSELAVKTGSLLIEDGRIAAIGKSLPVPSTGAHIDAAGRVVMPAFVDCHTHACWAGDRLDEWDAKLHGATYLELLAAGGGIMSTVRAVRQTSEDELADLLVTRLDRMFAHGTTTAEVKSGYGLSTNDELKMLRAAHQAGNAWPGRVVLTACIGHALDPDQDAQAFVDRTIQETLPAITEAFGPIAIDAYCEKGAWSVEQCERLFGQAISHGHPVRVHADQFNALGMVEVAVRDGYRSVDHLEATTDTALAQLAASNTAGVMLPCSGFHVDGRYGNGRAFIDGGGALAIATNCNPGSAPCVNMQEAIALSTRHLGLMPQEAIVASTVNGARLLGLDDIGTLKIGSRADVIMLAHEDERMLGFEFGSNAVELVIADGQIEVDQRFF